MRLVMIAACLAVTGCSGAVQDAKPVVVDAEGRKLSDKEVTIARLSAAADKPEADPVLSGIAAAQDIERRNLRLRISKGYEPTTEERAFLGGRDRAVTKEQRMEQLKERLKFNSDARKRVEAALKEKSRAGRAAPSPETAGSPTR